MSNTNSVTYHAVLNRLQTIEKRHNFLTLAQKHNIDVAIVYLNLIFSLLSFVFITLRHLFITV